VALKVIDLGTDPNHVYLLLGGLAAWDAAGYEIEVAGG
jgi:hypothetical protein